MTPKDKTKYSNLVKAHEDTLILQNESLFYTAYDEPAGVLSDITGYQLIQTASGRLRCSCLADKWENVKEQLEAEHISFIFIKKDEVIAAQSYDDNRYRLYADKKHIPDSIHAQKDLKLNTESNKGTIEDINRFNNALEYIKRMCDGLNPVTGKEAETISLNDPNILRFLFYIKEFMEKNRIE